MEKNVTDKIITDKPYVICHMLTSLDGKIDGNWFRHSNCDDALKAYGRLRLTFESQATLYGTTTAAASYSNGLAGELPHSTVVYPKDDYVADCALGNYVICLDPQGILGWSGGYLQKKGRAKAHVIEVLTNTVDSDYLAYLRKNSISYVFAGETKIDCVLLLHKLQNLFGIHRMILAGGGITNWGFAREGLIDELSIIVAPVADGSTNAVSIFEDIAGEEKTISMKLKNVTQLEGNVLWLTYTKQQEE